MGVGAGIIGLIFVPEPPNSVAINAQREEYKDHNDTAQKENIVCKILKSYGSGFKKIFTNLTASLVLLGMFSR